MQQRLADGHVQACGNGRIVELYHCRTENKLKNSKRWVIVITIKKTNIIGVSSYMTFVSL